MHGLGTERQNGHHWPDEYSPQQTHSGHRLGRHPSRVASLRSDMDAMSPSIAEAARRLLRTEDTTLLVPHALLDAANELSLEISDGIPKLIREPKVTVGHEHQITVANLCQIGGDEPGLEICWIPTPPESLEKMWAVWTAQIRDLMVAGYPGCTGCGGPGSEGDWEEMASRARMRVT